MISMECEGEPVGGKEVYETPVEEGLRGGKEICPLPGNDGTTHFAISSNRKEAVFAPVSAAWNGPWKK